MESSSTQTHFRLLDLPAELRNNIYEFAFTLPEGIYFFNRHFMLKDRATLPVALLRSCRQVYTEAIPILYSINKLPTLCSNLGKIGSKNISFVRAIETHTAPYKIDLKQMCILLKQAKKLEKLRLSCDFHTKFDCATLVKLMGPMLRVWHKEEMKKEAKERRNVLDIVEFLPYTIASTSYHKLREYDVEMVRGKEIEFRNAMRATFK